MTALRGERELQARLTAISGAKFGRPFMTRVALATVREAKLTVARKTGTTGRSIRMAEVSDDRARVTASAAAPFLEFGTKPHIIRPRRARVLAWPAEAAGRRLSGATRKGYKGAMVFAGRVSHPGTRAQPFLVPAARKALREHGLEQAIVEAWNGAA